MFEEILPGAIERAQAHSFSALMVLIVLIGFCAWMDRP